jgi:tetratricopeptide (TPR) repeat protein
MTLPNSDFRTSISSNLAYWQDMVDQSDDPALKSLIPESRNIYRAVEFGLALPETWRRAAELILDLHYFIEHGAAWRSWQILVRRALVQCAAEEAELRLRLLDRSGGYYRQDREWESSLAAHEEGQALARELGKKAQLAQSDFNLSLLFWRQRQYDKAAAYAHQALVGFQEVGAADRELGGVYSSLGLIEYGRGNYAESIDFHLQSVSYFRTTEFYVLLARSLVNLALAQEAGNEIDAAMVSYQEARSILEGSDYEMDKTRIELSLGSLFFNLKRYEEAEQAYLRAYTPYLKRSGLLYFQGLATNNLGNVYLEQGRLHEAEAILRESLSVWGRVNAPLQSANTTGTLGKTLAAQGKNVEALAYLDLALVETVAFPDDGWARQLMVEFQKAREELLQEIKSTGRVPD